MPRVAHWLLLVWGDVWALSVAVVCQHRDLLGGDGPAEGVVGEDLLVGYSGGAHVVDAYACRAVFAGHAEGQ